MNLIKEQVREELRLCGVSKINEKFVDCAFNLVMNRLNKVMLKGIVSEYFLLESDIEKSNYYHREYLKELKEKL